MTSTFIKIPSSTATGILSYQGTWNANTNSPVVISGAGTKGHYYIVSVAGSTTIDGESDWEVGDWILFSGSVWQKMDHSDIVQSVFGRTGIITAQTNDYTWAQIDKTISSLADITTRSAADLSSGTLDDARVAQSNVTQHVAAIDHNACLNYASNEHFTMLDEDDMSSNSNTQAVTQQSTKAYVDNRKRIVQLVVTEFTTDVATGDGAHYFRIPTDLNGLNLTRVAATVITAGTTGTLDIQIHNVTLAQDVLSTKLTIDSGKTDSATAATAAVINSSYDHVATADLYRVDIDAVHTTAPKGLMLTLEFSK